MKLCAKCQLEKPANAFYKDKTKKTGLSGYCKACDKSRDRAAQIHEYRSTPEYRAVNREWMKRYRAERPEYFQAIQHSRLEKDKEYQRLTRQRNPEKIAARKAVYWRVKVGKMPHPSTLQCGVFVTLGELPRSGDTCCQNTASEYHHYAGYEGDNRFKVQALCLTCHGITQRH